MAGELAVAGLGDEDRRLALAALVALAQEVRHQAASRNGIGAPQQAMSPSVALTTMISVPHFEHCRRAPTATGDMRAD